MKTHTENVIYENDDFFIYFNEYTNHIVYHSDVPLREMSALFAMGELIKNNSKYLLDNKLRNLEITNETKNDGLLVLDNFRNSNRQNIENNRSGNLNYFLERKITDNMPINIYMDLVDSYYPKLIKIVKNVKTLGETIDQFKIFYNELIPDLELRLKNDRYNKDKKALVNGEYNVMLIDVNYSVPSFILKYSPQTKNDDQTSDYKIIYMYENSSLKDVSKLSEDDILNNLPYDLLDNIKMYSFHTLQEAIDNLYLLLDTIKYNL